MEVTHKRGLPRGLGVSRFSVREVTGHFQYRKGNAGIQSIPKLSPLIAFRKAHSKYSCYSYLTNNIKCMFSQQEEEVHELLKLVDANPCGSEKW